MDQLLEFLVLPCCWDYYNHNNDESELENEEHTKDTSVSETSLSYVGQAAYSVLKTKHGWHRQRLWNVTSGTVVGKVQYTPFNAWHTTNDLSEGHDDWFPTKIGEIISRTEQWCDIMSLGPPDGLFMEKFKEAIHIVAERSRRPTLHHRRRRRRCCHLLSGATACTNGRARTAVIDDCSTAGCDVGHSSLIDQCNDCDCDDDGDISTLGKVTIRIMFGNIIGMPVNCEAFLQALTKDLPKDANLQLWVGAWRRGISWNHAKLIAVDGKYLHTGGHNMWDKHYLRKNPIHDLSLEMEGRIAIDGHLFANAQWNFIQKMQTRPCAIGQMMNILPDVAVTTRVTVSEYPVGTAATFPPSYKKPKQFEYPRLPFALKKQQEQQQLLLEHDKDDAPISIISLGRYGSLLRQKRPSDDAIIAMIDAAKNVIRLALQDLGPVCFPGTKITLPGCVWPKTYMSALGRAIWRRNVRVEILLSNPNSRPGGLTAMDSNYGNGWTCIDVAAEIIKTIRQQFPNEMNNNDDLLRKKVVQSLRLCFIRLKCGKQWSDGKTIGFHSKHFIVDDRCCYIGSQNLYICDLAEWGVVIDDKEQVQVIMSDYWNPMWDVSYTEEDCNIQDIMDGLDTNRDATEDLTVVSKETQQQIDEALRLTMNCPFDSGFYIRDEDEVAENEKK